MKFSDMDMLQDYEKDTRMAAISYSLIETESLDPVLRAIFDKAATEAAASQKKVSELITARGNRP